ncbi:PAS domain-containing protein [Chelatococcus daeguensis]|uniref:PAS domain-containing protein n=2 Tax=Chelatococcus TaxID=28209 RepID=A0AAC9JT73_9HYPH|nr:MULTISPECIES: PAS domain-containing protein [Chelatococcus]APF37905.1 hypothetical protein BOQ54_11670 [Chelatococcus daeguensis]KZE28402.1 hypothetical protein AVW15_06250 [Chelatococcus daeguensis]MBM3083352.1 PAS domain-containing protein [Chelatococcus daeguensis]CUA83767.1 Uncharacterized protein Ga0061061_10131 [Chelatococcus sambhunathii]
MKHVTSRALYDYWNRLRGERAAPERGEIAPGEIRHILGDTFILDIDGGEPLFRLAGARLCSLVGEDLKGRAFTSLWHEDSRHESRRAIALVLDNQAGVVAGAEARPHPAAPASSGQPLDLELMLLPLRYRGKTHARMLGALSPAAPPDWLGLAPLPPLAFTSARVLWPEGTDRPAVAGAVQDRRGHLMVFRGGRG